MTVSVSVEAAVLRTLGDVLNEPPEIFGPQTILASFGWDSLASLEALAQLESEFGITLDLRSFHDAHTVAKMVALVAGAVAVKSPAQ